MDRLLRRIPLPVRERSIGIREPFPRDRGVTPRMDHDPGKAAPGGGPHPVRDARFRVDDVPREQHLKLPAFRLIKADPVRRDQDFARLMAMPGAVSAVREDEIRPLGGLRRVLFREKRRFLNGSCVVIRRLGLLRMREEEAVLRFGSAVCGVPRFQGVVLSVRDLPLMRLKPRGRFPRLVVHHELLEAGILRRPVPVADARRNMDDVSRTHEHRGLPPRLITIR